MTGARLRRIDDSGIFEWPWTASSGLAILTGAAGGGGGGGGALCWEALNLFGGGGGGGGGGGRATTLKIGEQIYRAAGGDGGDGGGGGGLDNGRPVSGKNGRGCNHGAGGDGGRGALAAPAEKRIVVQRRQRRKGISRRNFDCRTARIVQRRPLRNRSWQRRQRRAGAARVTRKEAREPSDRDGFVVVVPLHADPGGALC